MALLGRRREVADANNAATILRDAASAMNAEFVAPSKDNPHGIVRGRMSGCTFELSVGAAERKQPQCLALTIRHFHTQKAWRLDTPGCTLPGLDADVVQAAVESACRSFSTTH